MARKKARLMSVESWIVLEKIGDIVLSNVEGSIVEIGIGTSTVILGELAEKHKRRLYSCDKGRKWTKWAAELGYENHMVTKKYSSYFMKGFSDDVALALLDGDHRYTTVIEEVNFFLGKLVTGGVMFLHDTLPEKEEYIYNLYCADSYLVRQELERREGLDVFTWPYTAANCGLTMVMKKEEGAPWFRR